MSGANDVHRILGISRDADAETVKRAYRAIARDNHPDRCPGDAAAAARFDDASRAYGQWLQDHGHRPALDASAVFSDMNEAFAQFEDLFGGILGATGVSRERGTDLTITLELTEADARAGCQRDVEVTRGRVCSKCAGAGGSGDHSACNDCAGTGMRTVTQGFFQVQRTCAGCRGAKTRWTRPCGACDGGLVRTAEKLTVVVPPGIEHGQRLRLAGRGDELAGRPAGHVYVRIAVEGHDDDETAPPLGEPRDRGGDVVVEVPVRARHLWFGGSLEVPTPDGSATVHVPRAVRDGHEIRIAGRGKPRAAGSPEPAAGDPYRDLGRSDLIVVLRVTPAVVRQRESLLFAAIATVVIAILVALSFRS